MSFRTGGQRTLLALSTRLAHPSSPSRLTRTAFLRSRLNHPRFQSNGPVGNAEEDIEGTPETVAARPDISDGAPEFRIKSSKKKKAPQPEKNVPQVHVKDPEETHDDDSTVLFENWQNSWGPDEFRPPAPGPDSDQKAMFESPLTGSAQLYERESNSDFERIDDNIHGQSVDALEVPFEQRESELLFTRRIEGVVEPDKMATALIDVPPPSPFQPVAKLKHKLDRVLFNPGVHWLQDPRSRVYNFDPYLQEIPPVTDFAFDRLEQFTPSSKDHDLEKVARREKKPFRGSTSSLSGMLCHIYFLLSGDRLLDTSTMSRDFQSANRTFTPGQRMPSSVTFHYSKDGRYAVDSSGDGESGDSGKNILTWMGTMLEKFVTMSKEEFRNYIRSNPQAQEPPPKKKNMREAFRFSKSKKFVMRSQLDCRDPRLPGTGVFDIKTRACMPIRMDIFNFEENSGYLIRSLHGKYESFEREYYDLIRSAFLKYQFQARIGNMDGVIVAYHNTRQLFGFQYIPVVEMDERLFGPGEGVGDRVFKSCLTILEHVAEEVVSCFPNQTVRATFETQPLSGKLNVWVEPVEWNGHKKGEARPIKQLEVQTWSYLNSKLAKSWEAFRETDANWSLRWSIAHLNMSTDDVRRRLYGARQRQFRAWTLPSGVDPEDLQEWYEGLNFGGVAEQNGTFNPDKWRTKEDRGLALLRRLAREGKKETERIRSLEEGKPRLVVH